jgi:hypothetical protein
MSDNLKANVIFDNGGGVKLKLDNGEVKYCHHYINPKLAAHDFCDFIKIDGVDLDWWDGNFQSEDFEVSQEDINNGCYKVYDIDDVKNNLNKEVDDFDWRNEQAFFEILIDEDKNA